MDLNYTSPLVGGFSSASATLETTRPIPPLFPSPQPTQPEDDSQRSEAALIIAVEQDQLGQRPSVTPVVLPGCANGLSCQNSQNISNSTETSQEKCSTNFRLKKHH
ncbi:hypothetical protein CK820_G0025131 [Pan troglodytes]|uniref:Uncharacterized protein n=1 Tax=Pan troglodytes TaxID=9598 RepID=A0A2J8M0G3_PANTR|nr:hypothetical protein CK820_G0025131 [Pan troglodytes]